MQQKLSLAQQLKKIASNQQLFPFQSILVIMSSKRVTLYECRRFLHQKYKSKSTQWRKFSNQDLVRISEQCQEYILSNRNEWDKQQQLNKQNIIKYHNAYEKFRKQLNFDRHLTKSALVSELQKHYYQSKITTQQNQEVEQQQKLALRGQLSNFIALVQSINQYQLEENTFTHAKDFQYNQAISQFISQFNNPNKANARQLVSLQFNYKNSITAIKKQLQSAYNQYCKRSKQQFLQKTTFIQYFDDLKMDKLSKEQMIKHFDKYKGKESQLIFESFWSIHKQLFEIEDELIPSIIASQEMEIGKVKQRCNQQMGKIQQLKKLLSANKGKIKSSPIKLNKSHSVKLPIIPSLNRQQSQPNKKQQGKRKNFITQIRQEILNEQSSKKDIVRNKSVHNLTPKSQHLVLSSLPKILKIPNQQIQSQGIYQSLKKFAPFDYINQQKKIKGIIGLPIGDDQEYMKAYFKKESQAKQQKQVNSIILKEQRRKKILQNISKNQSICRKNHLLQIEPYMRF